MPKCVRERGGARLRCLFRALPLALLAACAAPAASDVTVPTHIAAVSSVDAGKYAVNMAGCNGCHTPGWAQSGGTIPPSKWLTGSNIGYRGKWGTAYPVNVRLLAPTISRDAWIQLFKAAPPVPVMPFEDLGHGHVSDADLGAMYDFIVHLGKAGKPAPADLPPGKTPTTAYMTLVPARK